MSCLAAYTSSNQHKAYAKYAYKEITIYNSTSQIERNLNSSWFMVTFAKDCKRPLDNVLTMNISNACFVTSSPDVDKCPKTAMHEYAFIGRSNVGKSSLINMLTGNRSLAMTSATPGKTMLINHFLVDDAWYIVDLPGYGYARRSKDDRRRLEAMIKGYILKRPQMTCLFLLIDGRHLPQDIDLEFMNWLGENGVPFAIVFTKLDKMTSNAAKTVTTKYLETLREYWEELPPVFRTSSIDRRGRLELLDYIESLNALSVELPNSQLDIIN